MAEFKPLPPNPTNSDLGESLLTLHDCVEQLSNRVDSNLEAAKLERSNLRKGQTELAREVRRMKAAVQSNRELFGLKLDKVAAQVHEKNDIIVELNAKVPDIVKVTDKLDKRFSDINKTAWGVVIAVVLAVLTGYIAFISNTASRYTNADGARDHAETMRLIAKVR